MPFGTDDPLVAVGLRVSLDLPDPAVLHIGKDGTAVAASVAESRSPGNLTPVLGFGPGLEIQRAHGKGGCTDGGPLQKSAAA